MESNAEELLKLEDVAKHLKSSVNSARRLCESGKLRAFNIGNGRHRVWRIRKDDLLNFTPAVTAQPPKSKDPNWPKGVWRVI